MARSAQQEAIAQGMRFAWKRKRALAGKDKITSAEYRALAPPKKPHKYGARSVVIDGIRFPSKREGDRWLALKLRQVLGEIRDLERQVSYQLAPSVRIAGEKRARPALRFTVDFKYVEVASSKTVHEDSKGFADTAFRIRQHLMKSVHGIDVVLS